LKKKLEELILKRQNYNLEFFQYSGSDATTQEKNEDEEEVDALEAFMKINESKKEEESKAKILDKIKKTSQEIAK
jgi:hypothetical protein